MKKNIKLAVLLLVVAMLCATLTACPPSPDPTASTTGLTGPAIYTVKVVDPLGNPVTGMAVRFMRGGEQVGMALGNDEGIATKELERGDYTLQLSFTDPDHSYHIDSQALVMSATKTEAQIVVGYEMNAEARELFVGATALASYDVEAGCTYVKLASAGRNYFIFTPNVAGIYAFSFVGAQVTVGYYGSPYFVFDESAAAEENGTFRLTVEQSMIGTNDTGTTQMVIGVDTETAGTEGYLCIQKVGEPPQKVEWEVYRSTYTPTKYTLPAGLAIREFDLAAPAYSLVFNENDGYYHLNSADGPVVLVRLLDANAYTGFAFGNILLGSNVGTYHYDENGELVKKVLYNDCLQAYLGQISGTGENMCFTDGMCDDTYGVYPLTKDLETIIKNYGEFMGYWDSENINFALAGVPGLNAENAWLFLCCYAE